MGCKSILFSIQLYLYSKKSQQLSAQSALYCKVKRKPPQSNDSYEQGLGGSGKGKLPLNRKKQEETSSRLFGDEGRETGWKIYCVRKSSDPALTRCFICVLSLILKAERYPAPSSKLGAGSPEEWPESWSLYLLLYFEISTEPQASCRRS